MKITKLILALSFVLPLTSGALAHGKKLAACSTGRSSVITLERVKNSEGRYFGVVKFSSTRSGVSEKVLVTEPQGTAFVNVEDLISMTADFGIDSKQPDSQVVVSISREVNNVSVLRIRGVGPRYDELIQTLGGLISRDLGYPVSPTQVNCLISPR